MKASEVKAGRTFGVTFEHGDDFMSSLASFCQENDVRQGYIPMFLAGFAEAEIVGTCEKLKDPQAPRRAAGHWGVVLRPGRICGRGLCPVPARQQQRPPVPGGDRPGRRVAGGDAVPVAGAAPGGPPARLGLRGG
jgi:hypothetical protein